MFSIFQMLRGMQPAEGRSLRAKKIRSTNRKIASGRRMLVEQLSPRIVFSVAPLSPSSPNVGSAYPVGVTGYLNTLRLASIASPSTQDDAVVAALILGIETQINSSITANANALAQYQSIVSTANSQLLNTSASIKSNFDSLVTIAGSNAESNILILRASSDAALASNFESFTSLVNGFEDNFDDEIAVVRDAYNGAVTQALSDQEAVIDAAAAVQSDAILVANGILGTAIESADATYDTAIQTATLLFNNTVNPAYAAFHSTMDAAAATVNQAVTAAFDGYQAAVVSASSSFHQTATSASDSLNNTLDGLGNAYSSLVASASNAYNTGVDGLQQTADGAVQQASDGLDGIISGATTGYQGAIDAANADYEQTMDGAVDAYNSTVGAAYGVLKQARDAAYDYAMSNPTDSAGQAAMNAIVNAASDAFHTTKQNAWQAYDQTRSVAENAWNQRELAASSVWRAIAEPAHAAYQTTLTQIEETFRQGEQALSSAWESAEQSAFQAYSAGATIAEAAYTSLYDQAELTYNTSETSAWGQYQTQVTSAELVFNTILTTQSAIVESAIDNASSVFDSNEAQASDARKSSVLQARGVWDSAVASADARFDQISSTAIDAFSNAESLAAQTRDQGIESARLQLEQSVAQATQSYDAAKQAILQNYEDALAIETASYDATMASAASMAVQSATTAGSVFRTTETSAYDSLVATANQVTSQTTTSIRATINQSRNTLTTLGLIGGGAYGMGQSYASYGGNSQYGNSQYGNSQYGSQYGGTPGAMPQTVPEYTTLDYILMPIGSFFEAVPQTIADGRAIDSATRVVEDVGNHVVEGVSFGLAPELRVGPLFGNQEAYESAWVVSNATINAMTVVEIAAGVGAAKKMAGDVILAYKKTDNLACAMKQGVLNLDSGCFVSGTLVILSSVPFGDLHHRAISNWDSEFELDGWLENVSLSERRADRAFRHDSESFVELYSYKLADAPRIQLPIEQVPLGARVPTKNPKPWEFDDRLPEPNEADWVQVRFEVAKRDGSVVDIELLRPLAWMEEYGIEPGAVINFHLPELDIQDTATIHSLQPCPPLASGEGSVITGRFVTRQVDQTVRMEVQGVDGTIEVLEGTTIHPIWSIDRNDWVALGELEEGERLQSQHGPAIILSKSLLSKTTSVYNIEVHGEHVYEVGEFGILVHNTYHDAPGNLPRFDGPKPTYAINPAHVQGTLRRGKTPLPADAAEAFQRAVPDDPVKARNWFGRNADGQIYRFSGGNDGTAHFSAIDGVGDGIRNLTPYATGRLREMLP